MNQKCISVNKLEDKVVIEIEKEISLSVVGKTTMRVETKAENETWDELENLTVDEIFIKKNGTFFFEVTCVIM